MPTYLIHGFRWQRAMIRIHIILNDLEDAAPEWLMAPATSVSLLNSFYTQFDFLPPSNPPPASYPITTPHAQVVVEEQKEHKEPPRKLTKRNSSRASLRMRQESPATSKSTASSNGSRNGETRNGTEHGTGKSPGTSIMSSSTMNKIEEKHPHFNDWSTVKILEQYDPEDMSAVSQPYAYVGDYMVEVKLGASITDEMEKYDANIRAEEGALSPTGGASGEGLSAREIRRKSRRLGWVEKLRDGLQKGADIGWFVVVVGDLERAAPILHEEDVDEEGARKSVSTTSADSSTLRSPPPSAGLRNFLRRKSSQLLGRQPPEHTTDPVT